MLPHREEGTNCTNAACQISLFCALIGLSLQRGSSDLQVLLWAAFADKPEPYTEDGQPENCRFQLSVTVIWWRLVDSVQEETILLGCKSISVVLWCSVQVNLKSEVTQSEAGLHRFIIKKLLKLKSKRLSSAWTKKCSVSMHSPVM